MLVDASVARSFAVVGWSHHLLQVCGGTVLIADGVHGAEPDDPSELRRIRRGLQRQADQAGLGSGAASRALAAIQGLDQLLALGPDQLSVLTLNDDELKLAVRLQSRRLEDREWRQTPLTLWDALTGAPGRRTRDLLLQLVDGPSRRSAPPFCESSCRLMVVWPSGHL
jgi:hypothetical protein